MLTPALERFAISVASGASLVDAGKAVGISERTAYRWKAMPEITKEIATQRASLADLAIGQITSAMTSAISVLVEIARDSEAPCSARVSAAGKILDTGFRIRETIELVDEIKSLEERLTKMGA